MIPNAQKHQFQIKQSRISQGLSGQISLVPAVNPQVLSSRFDCALIILNLWNCCQYGHPVVYKALRGRLYSTWGKAQVAHNKARKKDEDPQMHQIIKLLWAAANELWKARNLFKHESIEKIRNLNARARMDARL